MPSHLDRPAKDKRSPDERILGKSRPGTPGRNTRFGELEQMQIDARAAELRSQGMTMREIALEMGCAIQTASDRVARAIAAVPLEAVNTIRETQLTSLARQKRVCLGILAKPPFKVDHGRVVIDPNTQLPMADVEMQLKASAELRRIEDAISRLTGTRAPVVHEVHEISEDAIDAELRRLSAQLGNVLQEAETRIAQGDEAGRGVTKES